MSGDESHGPSPLSASGVPSSFDSSPEFFDESRTQKLWRKLKQEPLIPVGCAATCYALYMATKSIREGDHHQTNRMFRARIYAQGFTLVALVAGSIFYKDERMKRKKFEGALEEKKVSEKRDKWIKELEARDREDQEWRANIQAASQAARDNMQDVTDGAKQVAQNTKDAVKETGDEVKRTVEKKFASKSVREEVVLDGWGPGMWVMRTRHAWKRM